MNFELNDDQRMIENLVERFAADHYGPGRRAAYRAMPGGFSSENWKLLGELGILGLLAAGPEEGGGPVETLAVMQALGRAGAVEPVLSEVVLAGRLLAASNSTALKTRWLAPLLAGEARLGFAFAEADSRYRLDRIRAEVQGGRLAGVKIHAPYGADAYVVTALEDGAPRLFLAAGDDEHVRAQPYRLTDGSLACEITFDAAAVERLDLGLDHIAPVLERARLAAAAEMMGIIEFVFAATLDYVKTRRQFGTAIGSFQAIQHRLADLYALKEQARSMLYRAALATGPETAMAVAAAKAYVSRAGLRIAEEAIQLHGGMGMSSDLDVGAGLNRILVLANLFGDPDHETARYNALRAA